MDLKEIIKATEPEQGEVYGTVIQLEKPLTAEEKERLHNMLNSNVPCFVDPEEQAIAKLYETDWLSRHDQELVRGIIKRIREHQQVIDKTLKVSCVDKDCYILAHDHIIDLLKREWGIDG